MAYGKKINRQIAGKLCRDNGIFYVFIKTDDIFRQTPCTNTGQHMRTIHDPVKKPCVSLTPANAHIQFIQVPAGKRHHDGRSLSARAAEYASSKMFGDSFFRLSNNLFTIFSIMNYFSRTSFILHSSSRCSTISIRSSRNVPKSHRNRTCLRFWLAKRRESDSSLILKGNLPFR